MIEWKIKIRYNADRSQDELFDFLDNYVDEKRSPNATSIVEYFEENMKVRNCYGIKGKGSVNPNDKDWYDFISSLREFFQESAAAFEVIYKEKW